MTFEILRKARKAWQARRKKRLPLADEEFGGEPRTLTHWKRKLGQPNFTIECSDMQILGRDAEGTIFQGPGRIDVTGDNHISFRIYGTASKPVEAFKKLRSADQRQYDPLAQFRLVAKDYDGNRWTGGYTSVNYFAEPNHGWPLTGELRGLSTDVEGFWVAPDSSVELLFIPPFSLPLSEWIETTTRLHGVPLQYSREPGRHVLEVLNTQIVFENDLDGDALWITAKTSNQIQHPFAERWLSEPLRILLGAPAYPRLTARNFGNGKGVVTLLPAPREKRLSPFGLKQPVGMTREDDKEFWRLYADILSMIALGRENGMPLMNGHEVTRLYEELSQALKGSHWVIMLTLASTIEALAKSLMSEEDRKSEFSEKALRDLASQLETWECGDNEALRGRALSLLSMLRQKSPVAFLRGLGAAGIVDPEQVKTWQKLRNSVMHGELVEPWSSEEGDKRFRDLVALTHALTRARIAAG